MRKRYIAPKADVIYCCPEGIMELSYVHHDGDGEDQHTGDEDSAPHDGDGNVEADAKRHFAWGLDDGLDDNLSGGFSRSLY